MEGDPPVVGNQISGRRMGLSSGCCAQTVVLVRNNNNNFFLMKRRLADRFGSALEM